MSSELTFFNSSDRVFHSDAFKTSIFEKDQRLSKIDLSLKLNSADPFPLLNHGMHSYQEAQAHSFLVDTWLGLKTEEIEKSLLENQVVPKTETLVQTWIGLPVQAMQTPYTEIHTILDLLRPRPLETIIDLGCGYGRMAHVVGRHYPDVHFIGYELVAERVQEGHRILQKFNYPNVALRTQDLSAPGFSPQSADYYFVFDFGSRPAIEKTLEDLKLIALKRPLTLVARGRGIRHWIYQGHPWLYAMNEPQVFDHFTIFKS